MEIRANVDYSRAQLCKMPYIVSCIQHPNGKLRVTTKDGKMYVFSEVAPNHWVTTDSRLGGMREELLEKLLNAKTNINDINIEVAPPQSMRAYRNLNLGGK